LPEKIFHNHLPDDVKVAFELFSLSGIVKDHDRTQNMSGASLLRKMAKLHYGSKIDVRLLKNEKPKAFLNGREISVSFSHTQKALSAVISEKYNVGCDIESVERSVSPGLIDRIKAGKEPDELYSEVEPIRIWTIKESALKMIGTGLRKSMNSIRVEQDDEELFTVDFFDGNRAKICSFKYQEHWITVCYQKL